MIKKIYFKHKETVHNFMWRSLQVLGKGGVTFFIFILCAKLLDPYDFGVYSYVLAVVSLLIIFGDFGISTATSKYVAEFNAIDRDKLKLILFNSLILVFGLGTIVVLFTIIFGDHFLGDKYKFILCALPLLFLVPVSSLYDGIFRGLKRFKELTIIFLAVGILCLIFVYPLVKNYGLIGALISQSLFYLTLVMVLSLRYGNLYCKFDPDLVKKILNYSLVIGVSSVAYFLYSRVDILVLGYFGYIKEIGYYELINKGFGFMFIPFAFLAQVISPNITTHFSKNNHLVVRNKFYFFLKRIVPAAVLIAFLFYYIFPQVIKIFLSEYYVPEMIVAVSILSFLIPAKIWGVFLTQSFVVATGYAKIIAIITLVGGILNVISDIIFIKWLGFTGVFWTTLIIHSLSIIVVNIWFSNKIKLKS